MEAFVKLCQKLSQRRTAKEDLDKIIEDEDNVENVSNDKMEEDEINKIIRE